ncbi:MAG: UDP-forming cellulose synthase catalytic subunit [Acuticoccus sp.]
MRILVFFLWLAAAVALVFLITQPISLHTHLITVLVVVVVIAVLKMFERSGVLRAIVLALGTAVVLRYIYWRTTETIPPVSDLGNFIPGLLLYLAELYSVGMLFLSLFVVAEPLNRPRRPLEDRDERPRVDVFVPSLNESPQLLATTLAAAKQMDYPADRLSVYLLDDGGTDQRIASDDPQRATEARERRAALQKLANELDVNYVTRAANLHAKAGNLNNGLEQSSGEFVVVLDADHAPARDFLNETLGHFADDPRLFLVQTPHFFINPDPLEHNLETWQRMPSENEMFYGAIQKGLDKWNASFFCGSAAVLRRTALEEAGGFSGMSITEDCETAIDLHSRGWTSAYVERPMIAGLQPETFASFIGQRSRWCQGMMQILILRNPLLQRGLTMAQRLCYLSSMTYWFFPFARTTFLFAPLCYLFFGAAIFDASGAEFAAYTVTYILVNLLLQNYLWNRVRWPFISELYETVQSVFLLRALGAVFLNPRKPSFRVTSKGETNRSSRISELGWPIFIVFFILILGVVAMVWRLMTEPYATDVTLVVGGWNLFNVLLVGAALGVVSERRQLRATQRITISRACEVVYGTEVMPARIDDVSIAGARIILPAAVAGRIRQDDEIILRFQPMANDTDAELPLAVRSVSRHNGSLTVGAAFSVAQTHQYKLVADLVFSNSDEWVRFQASRRKNMGIVRGVVEFLAISAYQTVRGLSYLVLTAPVRRRESEPQGTPGPSAGNGGPVGGLATAPGTPTPATLPDR